MCRNRRPCRIVPRCASSSQARDRRGRVPCSARMEWSRVRGLRARFFGEADSQFPLAAVGSVLRRADEHFYEVVVQRVVELALEAPFELRMVEVAGMEFKIIRVHRDRGAFELD